MGISHSYEALDQFINQHCPYRNNYCNGFHIPDLDNKGKELSKYKDKQKCQYYERNKCMHASHPYWVQVRNNEQAERRKKKAEVKQDVGRNNR